MAKRRKINKISAFLGILIIIALIAVATGIYVLINNPDILNFNKLSEENISRYNENIQNEELEEEKEDTVINIVGIGDTLCHSQNFKDAYDSSTGNYDFSPMFKNITKYFDNATIAVGNLETTLAGADRGYSGYPCFNSPEAYASE